MNTVCHDKRVTQGGTHLLQQQNYLGNELQGESSSLCWLTKDKQLRKGITILTQLYCQIHINISTTCFGPYGHCQVGYSIRGKNYII